MCHSAECFSAGFDQSVGCHLAECRGTLLTVLAEKTKKKFAIYCRSTLHSSLNSKTFTVEIDAKM